MSKTRKGARSSPTLAGRLHARDVARACRYASAYRDRAVNVPGTPVPLDRSGWGAAVCYDPAGEFIASYNAANCALAVQAGAVCVLPGEVFEAQLMLKEARRPTVRDLDIASAILAGFGVPETTRGEVLAVLRDADEADDCGRPFARVVWNKSEEEPCTDSEK